MSDLKTWDFMLAAASAYAHTITEAALEGQPPTAFGEPVAFWLNQTATDSAIEYSRLLREEVPAEHARVAVQLTAGHAIGLLAAEEILGVGYDEWRQRQGDTFTPAG